MELQRGLSGEERNDSRGCRFSPSVRRNGGLETYRCDIAIPIRSASCARLNGLLAWKGILPSPLPFRLVNNGAIPCCVVTNPSEVAIVVVILKPPKRNISVVTISTATPEGDRKTVLSVMVSVPSMKNSTTGGRSRTSLAGSLLSLFFCARGQTDIGSPQGHLGSAKEDVRPVMNVTPARGFTLSRG